MKENSNEITRRSFIGKTGAVAAGLTIIPGSVMSGFGYKAPSDKLEYCNNRNRWYGKYQS